MDTLLNFVAALGFVGSVALLGWGLGLYVSHALHDHRSAGGRDGAGANAATDLNVGMPS